MFILKYRRKVMNGQVKADVRKILKKLCKYKRVEIIEGVVLSRSCVFMCKRTVSRIFRNLKGKSTLMVFDKHPNQGSKESRVFWVNITEDAMKYIQEQQKR
ncbi:MAG: transposase [Vallitalea sp.]|nr:transposase [Vallitalea sp.]MCT4687108.1 transposase [Vallitalea sp.]